MRRQRSELELAHRLAVSEIVRTRDERLVRADKLATMGALATGIAHEVSTPLGVILGRAEQLLARQSDDRSKRAAEAIVAQTERIFEVIRGFLGLARGGEPALARHDAGAIARAAIALVEHRFTKRGVRLTEEIADNLPRVACDPRLFEQVLVNLLLNACDACEGDGQVVLSVDRASDGKSVAFVVTDDGVGIAPDVASRAAEPFFTTKPAGEGTGLGLAITSEIVKHHMGALTLAPRDDGVGTRARVELPSAKDES
jgi:signal transduction histidine kinase